MSILLLLFLVSSPIKCTIRHSARSLSLLLLSFISMKYFPLHILNQIARCLNEYGAPYNTLSNEVRAAIAELAALKFEVLQKVGETVGNDQTYQL